MIVAIIGQSGVGKSVALNFFKDKNAKVIESDEIVKQLYFDQKIISAIVSNFGKELLTENKLINKKKLREIVFNNEEQLIRLEKIIWPEMTSRIIEEIENAIGKLIILECTVLFNAKLSYLVDKVILIHSNNENKIARIKKRDAVSYSQAQQLLSLQDKHLFLNQNYDFIIENNGSIASFLTDLNHIFNKLKKI